VEKVIQDASDLSEHHDVDFPLRIEEPIFTGVISFRKGLISLSISFTSVTRYPFTDYRVKQVRRRILLIGTSWKWYVLKFINHTTPRTNIIINGSIKNIRTKAHNATPESDECGTRILLY
jgi:hypothetical protein